MTKIKRIERGWAGHYCLGYKCLFHLNTLLVTNKYKIIISTIGNCHIGKELIEIGSDRYYETMVFHAVQKQEFLEIDVDKEINTENNWAIDKPYQDNLANKMHETIVQEIINRIETGKL